MEQSHSREKDRCAARQEILSFFMEPEGGGLLPLSKEPVTYPFPEPRKAMLPISLEDAI
jgi:hypothetical protein